MLVQIGRILRKTMLFDIIGRSISMEMHGKQATLNEVTLCRLPEPDRDIGFAHGEIELFVGQQ